MRRRSEPGYETGIFSGTDAYTVNLAKRHEERAAQMAFANLAMRAQHEPVFRERVQQFDSRNSSRRARDLLAVRTSQSEVASVTPTTDEELRRRIDVAEAVRVQLETTRQNSKGDWASVDDREAWRSARQTISESERELERRHETYLQRERAYATSETRKQEAAAAILRAKVDDLDLQRTSEATLISEARRLVERSLRLSSTQQEHIDSMLGGVGVDSPARLARHIVATGGPAYRKAWPVALVEPGMAQGEDRRALLRYQSTRPIERRSATEGGSFGVAVPFDLDSSIIGTEGGLMAPVLNLCRKETMTQGDAWHGVSSTLSTGYAWVAEDGVAGDNALTLAQPTLPLYKAMCDIPVSFELLEDYGGAGFEAEMSKIFAQEYLSFMGNATLNGSGSGQPDGIFTQLMGTTTNPVHIVATTLGQLGLVDVHNAWKALPDKFRANGYWIMHPTTLSQLKSAESGAALADFHYTGQGTPLLNGRPVIESMYAPEYTGSTASTTQLLTLVDLPDGFLVANRMPTTVELTQPAPDPTTGRPNMQRFWISWLRVGMGLLDPLFGVILANS